MTTKTESKPKQRAPQYLAAAASLELEKLDEAIATSQKKTAEKQAARDALLKGLSPEVKALVDRLRGTKPA